MKTETRRQYDRDWQARNPKRIREYRHRAEEKRRGQRVAYNQAWRKANPEKVKAIASRADPETKRIAMRRWYMNHRTERCAKAKAYRDANPDKTKRWDRAKAIRSYGLTVADYDSMLERQDNACAVCERSFTKTPLIDHCHQTGRVRGLLCARCNMAVAVADAGLLDRVSKYVERVN
jgi:hypothetical protein